MKSMVMTVPAKHKPGLRVSFDEWGDMDDDKEYRAREMKRLKSKKKSIKDALANFDPDEHVAKAKKTLNDELRKCEMQMMEHDDMDEKE